MSFLKKVTGGGGIPGLGGGGGGGIPGLGGGGSITDMLNPMNGGSPLSPMFLPNFLQQAMGGQQQPGGMFVNNVWGGGGGWGGQQQPMSVIFRGQGPKSAAAGGASYTPSYSTVGASWVDPSRDQANARMMPGGQVL